MKKLNIINRICAILAFVLTFLVYAQSAMAVSVDWRYIDGRERVIVKLAPADGRAGTVVRTGKQQVSISLSSGSRSFAMAAPKSAKLFGGISAEQGGLSLKLKTAAFGYIVTRPSKDVLYVDLFNDPLGNRWKKAVKTDGAAPLQNTGSTSGSSANTPAASGSSVNTGDAGKSAATPDSTPEISPRSKNDGALLYPPLPNEKGEGGPEFVDEPSPVFSGKITPPDSSAQNTAKEPEKADLPKVPVPPAAGENANEASVPPDTDKSLTPPVSQAGAAPATQPNTEPAANQNSKTNIAGQGANTSLPANTPASSTSNAKADSANNAKAGSDTANAAPQSETPPVGQNIRTNPPRLGDPTVNTDDERDTYKIPAWPPIEMPSNLPKPPPPPPAGIDQMSGEAVQPLAPLPPFTVKPLAGVNAKTLNKNGSLINTAAFAFYMLRNELNVSFNLAALNPFAANVASAATNSEPTDEFKVVEAPFAYRARLNTGRDPNWVEQPTPVMIQVPRSFEFASGITVVNENEQATSSGSTAPAQPDSTNNASAVPAGAPSASAQAEGNSATAPAGGRFDPFASVPQSGAGTQGASGSSATASTGSAATAQNTNDSATPSNSATGAATATGASASGTTTAATSNAPAAQTGANAAPPATPAAPAKTVVYVDELGNPVEAPLDPEQAMKDVEVLIKSLNYDEALAMMEKAIKQHDLNNTQREFFLHRRADITFTKHENDLAANYQAIRETTTSAINFNTKSKRNAAAYMRLGYVNLMVNNSYEAAAYFNILRQKFPTYENLPLTYYYWGDYQYQQGNLAEAAEQFNYIVLNYPEHSISRDAALGLTRTYYRMGQFDEAYRIMEFVELRWPAFYLDYPQVLSMLGDVALRTNNLDKARSAYWLYYNLVPDAEDADIILTRLGDIYTSQKYHSAAVQVYTEAVERFPAKDGGIISLMRLAEDGIYDEPSINAMFKVFDRPYDKRAAEAYRTIIREYSDNPLVTLAKLKLAMWNLWQKDYITTLDLCSEIVSDTPNSPLVPRAREVAMSAFTLLAAEDAGDKRYTRAREVWQRYPILRTQEEFLDPESRLALAVSQWNSGFQDEALYTLQPFFFGNKAGEISELAMYLALNILTEHFRWEQIEELAQRIELWELTPQAKAQLDYARGLAYENMDRSDFAAPIWAELYESKALPPTQQANVAFYFARSVERKRDLESAYFVGRDSLKQLQELAASNPELADNEKIKTQIMSLIDISENAGQLQMALDYATEYQKYTSEGSLDQQSIVYRVSRIHKKKGDTADWIKNLEDLSAKYPDSVYGRMASAELASYRLGEEASRFSPNI